MRFIREENRIFLENEQGKFIGEITCLSSGDDLIIIDHTLVDNSYRGQGIAKLLVEKAVELAKEENKKIVPICSYVKAELKRNPKYKDIIAKQKQ